MSHEVETMAWKGEVPWHGLGYEVKGNISTDDWLRLAGLDWEIKKQPLYTLDENGKPLRVPNRFAWRRTKDNRVMTLTGHQWRDWSNKKMMDFMRDYARAGGLSIETAGSLRNGQLVWALAKISKEFEVSRGDKLKGYLLLSTSHIVGIANTARSTAVRVVCANTHAAAESSGELIYSQNHNREFNTEAAKHRVELAVEELAACAKRAKTLQKLKISIDDAISKAILPAFEPSMDEEARDLYLSDPPKRFQLIAAASENAPGAIPGTGWGAFNALTYFADHLAGRSTATRLYSAWYGDLAKVKQRAEKNLLELV